MMLTGARAFRNRRDRAARDFGIGVRHLRGEIEAGARRSVGALHADARHVPERMEAQLAENG
jgi:hypothetical protein